MEPLAPNATLLLYHLLQVVAWSAVGGIVGLLADRAWIQHRRPWGTILIGMMGAFALLGAHVGLGMWLEQYSQISLSPMWPTLIATTVIVAVMAGALEGLRDFLEHPLPPRSLARKTSAASASRRSARSRSPLHRTRQDEPGSGQEVERDPLPVPTQLPDWEPADESEDLIMLELD